MAEPDLRVVVGVKGVGAGEESYVQIQGDLRKLAKNLEPTRVKFGVDLANSKSIIKQQLQQATQGLSITIPAKLTTTQSFGNSFNTSTLDKQGRRYFEATSSVINDVKKSLASLGTVDVTNVFKTPQGTIQSFTAKIEKAGGVIENYRFKLAELNDGTSKFKGFVQLDSVLTDKSGGSGLEKTITYLTQVETKLANINSKTLETSTRPLLPGMSEYDAYNTRLQEVNTRLEEISGSTVSFSETHKREIDKMVADLQRYARELQHQAYDGSNKGIWGQISKSNVLAENIEATQLKIQNLKTIYSSFVSDPVLRNEWQSLFDQSKIVASRDELSLLNAKVEQFEQKLVSAGKNGMSIFSKFLQNFGRSAALMVIGGITATISRGIRNIYTEVVNLDTEMTELRKVTNESEANYTQYLDNAYDKAIRLGSSITDFVSATAGFARLGYTVEQSSVLAENAALYQNVGDEVKNADEATKSLISTMKAFDIAAENSITIVDKLNNVGNKTSISSGGLGDALQRSAASLAVAGNDINESMALIVAGNEVVQNPESVGTAWKTIAMRTRGMRIELEKAGLETEGMAETTSELRDKIMALTNVTGKGGFDIMTDENNIKSTYDMVVGIGEVWGKLSDKDHAAILELMSGKRNSNVLASAFLNVESAVNAYNIALNSAGSAYEEHEKWLDSIEAKQQQFTAQYQKFSNAVLNSELVKGTFDVGTGLLGWLTAVVEKLGALPALVTTISGIRSVTSNKGIFHVDDTKNWGGSGVGISGFWNNGNSVDFSAQLDADFDALTRLENVVKSGKLSLETYQTAMQGASTRARQYAVETQGATGAADAYRNSQVMAAGATQQVGFAAKAASIGVSLLNTAMNMLVSMGISLIVSALVQQFNSLVNAYEENNRKREEAARAANEERESLSALIDEYKRLAASGSIDEGSRITVKNLQQQITDLVGDQADNLDLVNGKLDDQISKLDQIAYKTAKDNAGALELKWEDATENFTKGIGNSISAWNPLIPDDGFIDSALKELQKYGVAIDDAWSYALRNGGREINFQSGLEGKDARGVLEEYKKLQELLRENRDIWSSGVDSHMFNSSKDVLAGIQEQIDLYQGIVDTYDSATANYFSNEAIIEQWEYLKKNSINTQEAFDTYVAGINNSTDKSEEYKNALIDLAVRTYPEFAKAAGLVTDSVEDTGNKLNSQADTITSLETALAGLSDEATVLQNAMAKLGEGSAAFDQWIGSNDNLKSLLDKFPDLRDEIEAYNDGIISASALQGAFNQRLQELAASAVISKFDEIQAGIKSLNLAYQEMGESGKVSYSALNSVRENFRDVKDIDLYIGKLALAKGNSQEFQNTLSELADALVRSKYASEELATADENVIAAMLDEAGVANSAAMAHRIVVQAKADNIINSYDLLDASEDTTTAILNEIQALLGEGDAAQFTEQYLYALRMEKILSNDTQLDNADSVESLIQMAGAAGASATALKNYAQAQKLIEQGTVAGFHMIESGQFDALKDNAAAEANRIIADIKSAVGNPFAGGSSYKFKPKTAGKTGKNETKEYIADIDKLYKITKQLTAVQEEINSLEAKNDLLDRSDYAGRIANAEALIDLKKRENDLLHQQTDQRRKLIQANVDELRGYGFDVAWDIDGDMDDNEFIVNNMEHLNELAGATTEETNELRKRLEDLIDSTEEMNDANVSSSLAWFKNTQQAKEYAQQLMQIRQEQADEWLDVQDHQIGIWENQGGSYENIISKYKEMMEYVHNLANEYRAAGFSEDSEEIRKLQNLWWEYNKSWLDARKDSVDEWLDIREHQNDLWENQGGNYENRFANYQQMMDFVHNYANKLRDEGFAEDSEEIRELQNLWWKYYNAQKDLMEELDKERLDALNDQKDAMESILDLTIELVKKGINDEIESLEKARDIYREIIDAKKESLELAERERSYQEKIDGLTGDLAELQAKADILKLDDSREGQLQYAEAMEQISEKQKELDDEQHDYSIENQQDALDREYELYANTLEDKITVLKGFLNDNEYLTSQAMLRIDMEGQNLYNDLLSYAKKYTDTSANELETMWGRAMSAAKEYASFAAGLGAIDSEISNLENGAHAQKAIDTSSVISTMKQNSASWHSATSTERKRLEAENLRLGALIGATRDDNGRWYRNGVPLYHKGGIVGSDEEFAKLQKGELVVPKDQVKPTMKLLEWGNTLAAMAKPGQFSGEWLAASAMRDIVRDTLSSPAPGAIVNNNSSRFAPQIRFEVQLNGIITDDVYNHLKPDMEQMVDRGLKDVFSHRS